jgi:hypothetical protein
MGLILKLSLFWSEQIDEGWWKAVNEKGEEGLVRLSPSPSLSLLYSRADPLLDTLSSPPTTSRRSRATTTPLPLPLTRRPRRRRLPLPLLRLLLLRSPRLLLWRRPLLLGRLPSRSTSESDVQTLAGIPSLTPLPTKATTPPKAMSSPSRRATTSSLSSASRRSGGLALDPMALRDCSLRESSPSWFRLWDCES